MKRKNDTDLFALGILSFFGLAIGAITLVVLYLYPVMVLTCRYEGPARVDCQTQEKMLGLILTEERFLPVAQPLLDDLIAADMVLPNALRHVRPIGDVVQVDVQCLLAEGGLELRVCLAPRFVFARPGHAHAAFAGMASARFLLSPMSFDRL